VKLKVSLIALGLLVHSSPSSAAGERYLIAIGNNYGAKDELPLRYAETDARRLADVLERLGGLAPQNTIRILGRDSQAVLEAIRNVDERIARQGSADSTLLVYYSGHADAVGLHLGSTVLSYKTLKASVKGTKAKLKLLILDGCRSGGLTRVKGARPAKPFAIRLEDHSAMEGLALISSSAAGEDSHESDKLRSSFFTHHLIGGLLGAADRNADRKVVLSEAYLYAYENTLRSSQKTLSLQHPTRAFDIKGRGDFVMSDLGAKQGRSGLLVLAAAGQYLLRGDSEDGPVIAELATELQDSAVALNGGNYFVQHRLSDHYRNYDVTLRPGQTTALKQHKYERLAYARLVRKGAVTHSLSHSLFIMGGMNSATLDGFDFGPSLGLNYGLDLSWASFGLRASWSRQVDEVKMVESLRTHDAFKLGLSAQRFFDVGPMSLGLGLLAEGIRHQQNLEFSASTQTRKSWGTAFGGLATIELQLWSGAVLRIEGGPLTDVLLVAETKGGAQVEDKLVSKLGWFAAGGLGWRF